jgi:hypothetical protein
MSALATIQQPSNIDQLTLRLIEHPLRQRSGGILNFKKFAEANGVDVKDKTARKEAMAIYNNAKIEFYSINRKALAIASSNPQFNITKFRINDKGGWDASGRLPSAAFVKAEKDQEIAARDAEISALQRELNELRKLVVPAV